MKHYQQDLKYRYKALKLTSPDEMLDCSSPEYINLTLNTDGNCSTTLAEIFNVQHNEKNVIVIRGGPGMGKSTLAINVCKCWAEGELLQLYHAVILLPLREKEIQDAKEVKDLLRILDDEMRKDVLKEIISKHGERICFIFEGFDELPTDLQKSSVFMKINADLPMCTLVYTTRPEAYHGELQHIATQVVTIEGFTEESVDKYILKTFQNEQKKAHDLKVQINSKPWIKNILHIPINVAIVCLIFFHSVISVLPDTLTEFYNILILRLILRHIKIRTTNKAKIEILKSLNDLPWQISDQFAQLCRIAFLGVLTRKMIFSSQDLVEMGIAAETVNGIGLLLVAPRVLVYGREKSYNFLHLTVQEFCAAWHLSKLSLKEEIKRFCDVNYLQMMMLFYSGITGLHNRAVLDSVLPYKQLNSKITYIQAHNALQYLYEAHNSDVCQTIGDHLGGRIHLNRHDTTPVLLSSMMHVINYFITEYKGRLAVIDMSLPNFVVADDLALLANSLVKRRELEYNTDDVVLNVSLLASRENTSMFYPSLLLAVENYPVAELYIDSIAQQGVLSLQFLLQLLCHSNALSVLGISRINIGLEGTLSLSTSIKISLRHLRMISCNLNLVVDEIGNLMSFCKSLLSANLSYNELGDHEVEKLTQHLTSISTLQCLDLSNNNITAVGINHLRGLMEADPLTLTSMELSCNPLKDEGVCLLLQTLKAPIEHIGLSCVEMTSSSCQSVANALHKVKSINLTVPDGPELIGLEIANTKLLENIELNDLNDSTHHRIINAVKQNNSIEILTLSYINVIADECVRDLCQFIKESKSIVELNIYCSLASPQILLSVAGSLAANNSLRYFDFSLDYEVGTYDHKNIKETVLEFLNRLPPVSALEELTLTVKGNYSKSDPYYLEFDFEVKINIDYEYHQNIEQRVKKINKIRSA